MSQASASSASAVEQLSQALTEHPRAALADVETPLHELPRLGSRLGIRLFVKRDDNFTLAFGGNKVRQLEYYFGQAQRARADTVLITGAVQSNFVRLCAAAARQLDMEPVVQLEKRVSRDDPPYLTSGNVLLDKLLGADIHYFDEGEDEQAADANLEHLATNLRGQGKHPYVIHLGIEHPPIGGLGYVRGALETSAQLIAAGIKAQHLVVATGSGLTHSGILVGCTRLFPETTVHGICVRRDAAIQRDRIGRRAAEIEQLLGLDAVVDDNSIVVDDSVFAPGYGRLNAPTAEAIRLAARDEALLLDPVYTGRAMAGLIARVRRGVISAGSTVVFLHSGGTPGLFAYQADVLASLETNIDSATQAS